MIVSDESIFVDAFIQELRKEEVDPISLGIDLSSNYYDVEDLVNDDMIDENLLLVLRRCKSRAHSYTNFNNFDSQQEDILHKIWT